MNEVQSKLDIATNKSLKQMIKVRNRDILEKTRVCVLCRIKLPVSMMKRPSWWTGYGVTCASCFERISKKR